MKNKTTWRHGDTRERLRDEHPGAGEQAGEACRRDRRRPGRRGDRVRSARSSGALPARSAAGGPARSRAHQLRRGVRRRAEPGAGGRGGRPRPALPRSRAPPCSRRCCEQERAGGLHDGVRDAGGLDVGEGEPLPAHGSGVLRPSPRLRCRYRTRHPPSVRTRIQLSTADHGTSSAVTEAVKRHE